MTNERRLAVIGSPIAHSQSPAIHAAAYRELGLPWTYDRVELGADDVASFFDGCDPSWLGVSVTAPNKPAAARWVTTLDAAATLTGAVNTVRIADRAGWNTDVRGITRAFQSSGLDVARTGVILGSGATAASALMGLAELGVEHLTVAARTQERAAHLHTIADRLGVRLRVQSLETPLPAVDAAVSTIPGGAELALSFDEQPGRLLDAAYAADDARFARIDRERVIGGIEMLVQQALVQVRIFVTGDPHVAVPHEARVWGAMRAAVGLAAA